MVASIVQTKPSAAGIATSVSATFTSTPTAGNLLVAVMKENGANAVTLPSGFVNVTNSPYTGGSTRQLYVCYKVSDGTESGALTFSNADSNNKSLELYELAGIDTSSPVAYSAGNTNQVGVTTKALTSTGTLSKASNVAIAVTDTSLSNGGSETLSVASGYALRDTATFDQIMVADQVTTATTALAPTFSWATSRSSIGFQAVFQAADVTMAASLAVTATIAADMARSQTLNAARATIVTIAAGASVAVAPVTGAFTRPITASFSASMSRTLAPEQAPDPPLPVVSVWEDQGGNDYALVGSVAAYDVLNLDKRFLSEGSWDITTAREDDNGNLSPIRPGRMFTVDWRGVRTTWMLDTWNPSTNDKGERTLEASGPSALHILGWEQAWPDPTLGIGSQPDPGVLTGSGPTDAETIIRTLVNANWVTRRGGSPDLALTSNAHLGGTVRARGRFDNLLELLVKKAKVGEVGFDVQLVNTSTTRAELRLIFWEPSDKSQRVSLSEELGTIASWSQPQQAPSATKAVVAGAGGTHQVVTTAESIADATLWGGHRVVYVPLPDTYDADDQIQAGEEALKDGKATVNLTLSAADNEGLLAFTHYNVGDKVRGIVDEGLDTELDIVDVITSIRLQVDDGYPDITATFGDPDASEPVNSMAQLIRNQDRRLRQVEQRS